MATQVDLVALESTADTPRGRLPGTRRRGHLPPGLARRPALLREWLRCGAGTDRRPECRRAGRIPWRTPAGRGRVVGRSRVRPPRRRACRRGRNGSRPRAPDRWRAGSPVPGPRVRSSSRSGSTPRAGAGGTPGPAGRGAGRERGRRARTARGSRVREPRSPRARLRTRLHVPTGRPYLTPVPHSTLALFGACGEGHLARTSRMSGRSEGKWHSAPGKSVAAGCPRGFRSGAKPPGSVGRSGLARFDRETNRPTLHICDDVLPYVREQGVTRGSDHHDAGGDAAPPLQARRRVLSRGSLCRA